MALLTPYWGMDGLLVLLASITIIYFYLIRNINYWKKHGVKQISSLSPLGSMGPTILARKSFIDLMQDMYETGENEPYIGFYVLDKPSLLIRDPELIKNICIKDFKYFSDRNAHSSPSDPIKNNIFAMQNPEWKYMRQKLSPIFTTGKMKQMFMQMLEVGDDLDTYMKDLKLEGEGRIFEVKDICAKFTTDVIGITAYGLKFNSLKDPDAPVRKVGKDIFGRNYVRHVELLSTLIIRKFVKIFGFHLFGKGSGKFLNDIFFNAMEERKNSKSMKNDLINLLINIEKNFENDEQRNHLKILKEDILAQAAVFFTGGFETSSSTMSFALYELAKHPEWQQKVREELNNVLEENNGKITYEMISSANCLPYMDMVVSEILRMYPVLPFLDRRTISNYNVPGTKLTIEEDTPILIPMRSIHMDAKHFPNPHVFDPERFSADNKRNIKSNTYFPFGDGPRICIGMRLGLIQSKLGLCHLLSKYEFSPCQETSIPIAFDTYSVLTTNVDGITLRIKQIPS